MTTLPKQIQSIIDDAEIAASVLQSLGPEVVEAAYAMSMGHGVISNCNFLASSNDLFLKITEDKDGRANITICRESRNQGWAP